LGNRIGSESALELTESLPKGLTYFNLSCNQIGDKCVLALAKYLPEDLKELYLHSNQIGDDGALELAKYLPKRLTHLNLSNNQIRVVGALALANRLHLSQGIINFDISYNSMSPEEQIVVRNLNDIPNLRFKLKL
jgi:Leucine-rich repeat (LRR) protein